MTHEESTESFTESEEGGSYVYALTDDTDTRFNAKTVFYVGKGTGWRFRAHLEEALANGEAEPSDKIKRILALPSDDDFDSHVWILVDGLSPDAALRVEAETIHLLQDMGVRLTNKIAGQGEAWTVRRAPEHPRYGSGRTLIVDKIRIGNLQHNIEQGLNGKPLYIMVNGSNEVIERFKIKLGEFVDAPFQARYAHTEDPFSLRGWDVADRWDDKEAEERAVRFWRIGRAHDEAIAAMQGLAAQGRLYLGMIINDVGPVLRYLWPIKDSAWEYYDNSPRQFGFPVDQMLEHHPWLNKILEYVDDKGSTKPIGTGMQGSPIFVTESDPS